MFTHVYKKKRISKAILCCAKFINDVKSRTIYYPLHLMQLSCNQRTLFDFLPNCQQTTHDWCSLWATLPQNNFTNLPMVKAPECHIITQNFCFWNPFFLETFWSILILLPQNSFTNLPVVCFESSGIHLPQNNFTNLPVATPVITMERHFKKKTYEW